MTGQRGFTLIEVVVAFSLLAVGLGIAMQIAVGSLQQARNAAEFTEVALYAQSLLDGLGVGERLEEGGDSGRFAERYDWQLEISPWEVEFEGGPDSSAIPVELYRLDLWVSWPRGKRVREVHFATLRALTPGLE